jgi:hypothetical protein
MKFTDNPLERLMQERPGVYRDRPPHKCRGCARWRGEKCRKCTRKGGTSGQPVPKFA